MKKIRKILDSIKYCSCCKQKIFTQGYNKDDRLYRIIVDKCLCYTCAYWQDLIDYPPSNIEILGHKCIRVFPPQDKKDKSLLLGGKGKMRYFMRDDWSVLCSNDIWTIGDIPEHFQAQLPPTLTEITKRAYTKLKKHNKKCSARACLNRYMCFRYDLSLEDETGAFNKVPPNWNPKKERCGSFIDRNDILTDESNVDINN